MSKTVKSRRFFLHFMLVFVFMLTACKSTAETTEKQTEEGSNTETSSESNDGFRTLLGNVDDKTVKMHRCTLTFENLDNRAVSFDRDQYVIETWKNNKWISVQPLREIRSTGLIQTLVQPGKKAEEDINWISEYGELSQGKYRILIPATFDETTEEAGKIVAEFEVENKNDTTVDGLPTGNMYDPTVYIQEISEYGIRTEVVEPNKDGCNLKYSYTDDNQTNPIKFEVGDGFVLQKWDWENEQWSSIHIGFSDGVVDTSSVIPTTVQICWKEIIGEQTGVFRIIVPVVSERYLGDYKVFFLSNVFVID